MGAENEPERSSTRYLRNQNAMKSPKDRQELWESTIRPWPKGGHQQRAKIPKAKNILK